MLDHIQGCQPDSQQKVWRRRLDVRHAELMVAYDRIGAGYRATRRPDPRIASQVHAALSTMGTVLDVGAGAGSYEPPQTIVAIEPSTVMIAQRPPGSAPCIRATAEALPLRDNCVDAAMAMLTVHHWGDVAAGIEQLRRVTRHRVVVLTWDQTVIRNFWLLREYLPEAARVNDALYVPIDHLVELLGGAEVQAVPVPWDCADGFGAATGDALRPTSTPPCVPGSRCWRTRISPPLPTA
jgi:SAM-dependent methyltransferase